MALQKQIVSFRTSDGVDSNDTPALVPANKFLLLQNAIFTKDGLGELHKRNGYNILTPISSAGALITGGQALAALNGELDLIAGNQLYGLSPTVNRWIPRGSLQPLGLTQRQIAKTNSNESNLDMATLNGVSVFAWEDAQGGVWCSVIDETNGSIFQSQVQLNTTGTCPKVISTGTLLLIICSDTMGNILRYTVTPGAPTSNIPLTGTNLLSSVATPSSRVEAIVVNGYLAVTYLAATTFNVGLLNLATFAVVANSVIATCATNAALALAAVGTSLLAVVQSSTNVVGVWTLATPSLTATFSTPAALTASAAIETVTAVTFGSSIQVYARAASTMTADRFIQTFSYSSGSAGGAVVLARGVGLGSAPWVVGTQIYLLLTYPSVSQQTFFVANVSTGAPVIIGKSYLINAGPLTSKCRLPVAQSTAAGYSLAVTSQVLFESIAGKAVSVIGSSELLLNFNASLVTTAQLGQNLHVSTGALLKVYDGVSVTSHGFEVFPEPPTVPALASSISITLQQVSNDLTISQIATIQFAQAAPASGKPDASLIIPGEYFVLNYGSLAYTAAAIYFTVDGVGAAPSFSGFSSYAVAVASTDTAAQIATKTIATLLASGTHFPGANYIFGQPSATSILLQSQPGNVMTPSLDRQFTVSQIGYTSGKVEINCCPGNLIRPSQSFLIQGTGVTYWFLVDGFGSTPVTGFNPQSIVTILSTYTAAQVATAVAGATGGTANGNQVIISGPPVVTPSVNTNVAQTAQYTYVAVYEWIDGQGQLHQSAPSFPTTLQLPTFTGAYIPPVVIPQTTMLRLVRKPNVSVVFYRTVANGTILYRATSPQAPIANSFTVDFANFTDQVSDSVLLSSQPLYTQPLTSPTTVTNDAPPAFLQVIFHLNRLWGISAETPNIIWFSQQFQTGLGVAWSQNQTIRIPAYAGPITSLASMDGNLIAFEINQIWLISGLGPDALGNGGFSGPTLVSSTVGCRDTMSVVITPSGLAFKSAKGFFLLLRSFQVQDLGVEVTGYNADIVTAAELVNDSTQIRFLSATGTTLLYDYRYGQWSTFSNHQGVDSQIFNGVYYYLRSDGVYQEAPGTFLDGSTGYPLLIQTAWLKLNQIQGYGRVWKVFLKGIFPGTNPIQIQTSYDYDPTVADTVAWNPGSATAAIWGSDPVWGKSSPWGSGTGVAQPDVLQLRYDPNRQLCEAIQFTLTDLPPYPVGRTWGLDAIDLEVGIRKGGFKINTNQRIG